jgi:hypothetical protein
VLSHASALDVGASMRATMHKLHTALQPATPLQEDVIDLGSGATGTVLSFEATDRDCAWCAATSLIDGTSTSWELEAWNGPSVEAPHLYASLEDDGESIEVEVDFRPRLDAGYDLDVEATPEREYPAPTSRAAFSQKALRVDYDELFFSDEARAWRATKLVDAESVTPRWATLVVEGRRQYGDEDAGAVGGPLALRARYPRDAVEAAVAVCDEAADRYINWMTNPAEASWMRTRLIFARDSQVRQAVASKRVSILGERFGAAGRDLAKAMNGRLDMQGHNMMQEQVAFGDDADDGRD